MPVIIIGIIPRLYTVCHTLGFFFVDLAINLITRFTRPVIRPNTVIKSITSSSVPLATTADIRRMADDRTAHRVIYFDFIPEKQSFPALRRKENKYVPNKIIIKAIAAI